MGSIVLLRECPGFHLLPTTDLVLPLSLVMTKTSHIARHSSSTGVVNVYDAHDLSSSVNQSIDHSAGLFAGASPKPIRELLNLTTEVTNVTFNHDSQMMAISSSKKKDAFRMVSLHQNKSDALYPPWLIGLSLVISLSVPLALCYGVYQLADIVHPARSGHLFRFFRWQRVRRHG